MGGRGVVWVKGVVRSVRPVKELPEERKKGFVEGKMEGLGSRGRRRL